ncbi:MAG: hypothetical protein H6581_02845 [Bacteroidia bacterium]|nr:hypothetical protein [Bacteroidia bacterium]
MGKAISGILLSLILSLGGGLAVAQNNSQDSAKGGTKVKSSSDSAPKTRISDEPADNLNPQKEDTLPTLEEILNRMGTSSSPPPVQQNPTPPPKGQRLEIINADLFAYKEIRNRPIRRLIGNVHLRQDTTDFLCDSAYQYLDSNQIEAFSNVKIILKDTMQIRSQFLSYKGNTKVAEFYQNVILTKGKTVLKTNRLTYFRNENYSFYSSGGTLTDGDNVLKSKRGYYYPDDKIAFFKGDVTLENKEFSMKTDTLGYDTGNETAIFNAPTQIQDQGDNLIYTERGFYDTHYGLALFYHNPYMRDSTYQMYADTFFYDRKLDFGRAKGKVELTKLDSTIKVFGNYGEFEQIGNQVMITDSAYAVQVMDKDTLYLLADTLWTHEDSIPGKKKGEKVALKYLRAFGDVHFYMNDLQGANDSLVYFMEDSLIIFMKKPFLWSGEQQLTGDTIRVYLKKQQIDSLWAGKKAFLISKEDTIGFNQMKGKWLSAKFRKNKLSFLRIQENTESMYFAKDSKNEYMGMNQAKCNAMTVRFKENKPSRISFISQAEGVFSPLHEVIFKENQLEGFNWRPDKRPEKPRGIYFGPRMPQPEKTVFDSLDTEANVLREILDKAEQLRDEFQAKRAQDSINAVRDSLKALGMGEDISQESDNGKPKNSSSKSTKGEKNGPEKKKDKAKDQDKEAKPEPKKKVTKEEKEKAAAQKKKDARSRKAKRKQEKLRKKAAKAAEKDRKRKEREKEKSEPLNGDTLTTSGKSRPVEKVNSNSEPEKDNLEGQTLPKNAEPQNDKPGNGEPRKETALPENENKESQLVDSREEPGTSENISETKQEPVTVETRTDPTIPEKTAGDPVVTPQKEPNISEKTAEEPVAEPREKPTISEKMVEETTTETKEEPSITETQEKPPLAEKSVENKISTKEVSQPENSEKDDPVTEKEDKTAREGQNINVSPAQTGATKEEKWISKQKKKLAKDQERLQKKALKMRRKIDQGK